MGMNTDHTEFRVLAAPYDQVQIIMWHPSWVISPFILSESRRQVFCVGAASHAAAC